jgi:hypothetical protein
MDETQLLAILTENISFQLRHAHYDRTVEVGHDCHMFTTGKGQDKEVLKYRRFEAEPLKAQRLRLNNPATPTVISEADILNRLTRVDGVRRELVAATEKEKQELETALWEAFLPGVGLEAWLIGKVRHLTKNDPNAWILYDRNDRRRPDGEIERTNLRPAIFRSIDVLNFGMDSDGIPSWVLFRDFRMEYKIEGGLRRDVQLETYYMYDTTRVIKAREIGAQTVMMEGEMLIEVDVYPVFQSPEMQADGGFQYQNAILPTSEKKRKAFYISTIEHGAGEVPAFCVGAYPDEETNEESYVSWFWDGRFVLKDVIRDKQMLDVAIVMQAFRRRSEFSPACEYETENHERCEKGWIYAGEHGKSRCPSCQGSGLRANFNTEQEVLRLAMPEGLKPDELLELSKLAFEEPTDTALLEWFDSQLEKHKVRFSDAVLGRETSTKPTGASTDTATAILKKTDAQADILRASALVVCQGIELAFRVLANYREYGPITVNYSYPEKIDMLTLEQEVANFSAIQQVDIYEAKVHQRHRILAKQFEGEPETHKRIVARYAWLPFDDKSPEQQAQIISILSPTDSNAILWAYWKQIFQEIEVETPNFHLLKYEQQKAIVDAKVNEYRAKIELAGADVMEEPNFNEGDNDEPPNEGA